MGGGPEDQFLEGSVLGASFWRWRNRVLTGGEPYSAHTHPSEEWWRHPSATDRAWNQRQVLVSKAAPASTTPRPGPSSQELPYITSVVPRSRPQPPRRPAPTRSKPIEIPTKKPVSEPVFGSVAEDKRYMLVPPMFAGLCSADLN